MVYIWIVIHHLKNQIMGVMSCSRSGCDQIMCDTCVNGIGYVCNECQEEFKGYLNIENVNANSEGKILGALALFMDTQKGHYKDKQMDVNEFFKGYTR